MQQPNLQGLLQVELIAQSLLQQLGKVSKVQLSLVCQAACSAVRSEVKSLKIHCDAGVTGLAGRAERLQQRFPNCTKLVVQLGDLAEASKQLPDILLAAARYGNQLTALTLEKDSDAAIYNISCFVLAAAVFLPSLQTLKVCCWEYPASTFEALSRFSQLSQLQLSSPYPGFDYRLMGPISGLTALKQLKLEMPAYLPAPPAGSFPHLSNLPQLTSLHLGTRGNDISALTSCLSLQELQVQLGANYDADALALILSELTGLTQLVLLDESREEQFARANVLPGLRRLDKLQILNFPELSGEVLRTIAGLSGLTELKGVWWVGMDEEVGEQQQGRLPVLSSLKVLDVFPGYGEDLFPFSAVPHLTKLEMNNLHAAPPIGSVIQHCTQLQRLSLGLGSYTGSLCFIRDLARLPCLSRFQVTLRRMEGFGAIGSLSQLTHLEVEFHCTVSIVELASLLPMRRLSSLVLRFAVERLHLTGGEVMAFVFGMMQLKVLELEGVGDGTQQCLITAVGKLREQVGKAPELQLS